MLLAQFVVLFGCWPRRQQWQCVAPLNWADERRIDAESRWATFETGNNQYFAVSVQADPTGSYPRPEAYEIVVLMDTSATQTGPVRIESIEVLEELAASLPGNATVSLMACDVDTVDLSGGLVAASSDAWQTALARLQSRIPLGATDLSKAIRVASEQFQSPAAQKTIVYIGDGVNRKHFLNTNEHRQLVERLVNNQITLSSLAIGPIVDVATLAAFANQTGGVLYSRSEIQETTQAIGHNLGQSCLMPVVWVADSQLPEALRGHFPLQFPPLRADRDSVIVGLESGSVREGPDRIEGNLGWTASRDSSSG